MPMKKCSTLIRYLTALAFSITYVPANALEKIGWETVDPRTKEPVGKLSIPKASAEVTIDGLIATTKVTFTLDGLTAHRLEALARIPVREGQAVTGFRWQLPDGTIREGVGVGKSVGTRAYESVVQRRIDPALIEWESESALRLHVFPLDSKTPKRVEIEFTGALEPVGDEWVYYLPVRFDPPEDWQAKPALDPASEAPSIRIPRLPTEPHFTTFEREGERFFAGALRLKKSPPIKDPKTILLAWDVSASARDRNLKAEWAVLDALFAGRDCEVELLPFSYRPHKKEAFVVKAGDWKALNERLENLAYDGATNLGALDISESEADLIILSGDCSPTVGSPLPKLGSNRVSILDSISAETSARGKAIAAGGGTYVHLGKLLTPEKAAHQLRRTRPRIEKLSVGDAEIQDVQIRPFGREIVWVTGRFYGDGEEVVLEIENEKEPIRAPLHPGDERVFEWWAANAVTHPSARFARADRIAISIEAGIVTPLTSLIVLESPWDYERWGIALPPDHKRAPDPRAVAKLAPDPEPMDVTRPFKAFATWWDDPKEGAKQFLYRTGETPRLGPRDPVLATDFPEVLRAQGIDIPENFFFKLKKHLEEVRMGLDAEKEHFQNALRDISKQVAEANDPAAKGALIDQRNKTAAKLKKAVGARLGIEWGNRWPKGNVIGNGVEFDPKLIKAAEMVSAFTASMRTPFRHGIAPPSDLANMFQVEPGFLSFGGAVDAFAGAGGGGIDPFSAGPMDPFVPAGGGAPFAGDAKLTGAVRIGVANFRGSLGEAEIGALAILDGKPWEDLYAKDSSVTGRGFAWFTAVAENLASRGKRARAARVICTVAEYSPTDFAKLRAVGWLLIKFGAIDEAIAVFHRIADLSENDIVAKRDLALALGESGRHAEAALLLHNVARSPSVPEGWSGRICSLIEMNRELALLGDPPYQKMDPSLVKKTPLDLRIVLEWNREDVDLDLEVIDPNFEKLNAQHPAAPEGGVVPAPSRRLGPEEFRAKVAPHGTYSVRILNRRDTHGDVVARIRVFINWGRPEEEVLTHLMAIPIGDAGARTDVATVAIGD